MTEYTTRVRAMAVIPVGEPIPSVNGTDIIRVQDEGYDEFLELQQANGTILVDAEAWPTLRAAIDQMFSYIADAKAGKSKASAKRKA